MTMLIVALGGAIGAFCRYWVSSILTSKNGFFRWSTLAVNLGGALVIGFIQGLFPSEPVVLFVSTGLLGGFTTYATLSLDAWRMLQASSYRLFFLYVTATFIGGLALCGIGWELATLFRLP
ncbi:CrcB family protein [Bacillaceae bacterium SIJ1]|uniref:fluoride efflux transporter FluC n=1 Tax=Litoribacterium kuwaitense TaxID=1398745 RepID=UPI0013EC75EB|nr:CrcB family protein [Litoribacterium kuwaitense]NGP45398.1 CrcB family protein [Litoribacterium kuwaitense]